MSISRWMDKKAVVHIHNGVLKEYIKKNTFESVLVKWMNLEPIIQSEICQKEKHQYSTLMHIYGIEKDGNDNHVSDTAKETMIYRTVFWTLWEREGGMIWENGIKTCIISYKNWITSPGLMQDTGSLGLVHWEAGGGFRMGNMCTPVADACWCMAKPIQYCKVKKKLKKKKKE